MSWRRERGRMFSLFSRSQQAGQAGQQGRKKKGGRGRQLRNMFSSDCEEEEVEEVCEGCTVARCNMNFFNQGFCFKTMLNNTILEHGYQSFPSLAISPQVRSVVSDHPGLYTAHRSASLVRCLNFTSGQNNLNSIAYL